jgi:uncharacterized protein
MWKWFMMVLVMCLAIGGFVYVRKYSPAPIVSPLGKLIEKPLDKYTIVNLGQREFTGSQIMLDDAVATTSAYTSYIFHFTSEGRKVTGLAHIPASPEPAEGFPVIVQFRGYVDREKYTPGEGTKRSAEVFARNGFISLAPDFLGYGGSDMPGSDIFEERFQTYVTALNLLASIPSLSLANASKVGIWGHSNGGQIALTILEILGSRGIGYPTTLWAPVTKPFPYSILYYTDDSDDHGKALRKRLSEFENNYDAELYSLTNYIDRIAAPIQIHQGTADDAVPIKWSDIFVAELKKKEKDVTYHIYPGADHNMLGAWNTVVARDIEFFRNNQKSRL